MVMESTRGHEPTRPAHYKSYEDRLAAWSALLDDSDARGGGPVMVPCFAIQRAQELWFDLDMVLRTTSAGRPDTNGRPRWLSLDAPLAARMTDVYAATLVNPDPSDDRPVYRNPEIAQRLGLADEHAVDAHLSALWARVRRNRAPGGTPRAMHDATLSRMVALAGSGMCEGGRIVNFIVDQITNSAATVVLCGYAPPDTGAGRLRLLANGEWPDDRPLALGNAHIEPARVRARMVDFGDYYSGHGDVEALARFVFERPRPPARRVRQRYFSTTASPPCAPGWLTACGVAPPQPATEIVLSSE